MLWYTRACCGVLGMVWCGRLACACVRAGARAHAVVCARRARAHADENESATVCNVSPLGTHRPASTGWVGTGVHSQIMRETRVNLERAPTARRRPRPCRLQLAPLDLPLLLAPEPPPWRQPPRSSRPRAVSPLSPSSPSSPSSRSSRSSPSSSLSALSVCVLWLHSPSHYRPSRRPSHLLLSPCSLPANHPPHPCSSAHC